MNFWIGFQTDEEILFGDRKTFETLQKVVEGALGIVQRKGFYIPTFLVEDEIATGFLREVNTEVEHDSFSFLLVVAFEQVSSLHGFNPT